MNEVVNLNDNDILLGRGGKLTLIESIYLPCFASILTCLYYFAVSAIFFSTGNNNKHVGNEQLRILARSNVRLYSKSSKKEKSNISRSLVNHIRNLSPPGRFLKKDTAKKCWTDVGDDTAREKASQALRDAVSEMGKGGISLSEDMRPLSPPSLPSYRQHFTEDDRMDYKRRRYSCPRSDAVPYHNQPPPPIPQIQVEGDLSTTPNMTSTFRYDKRPRPVVTPEDPEHWREIYSSNNDLAYNNKYDRMTSYSNYNQRGFTERVETISGNQTQCQGRSRGTDYRCHHETTSKSSNKLRTEAPEYTPSYVSSDSQYDSSFLAQSDNERLDNFDFFEW
jgi:hypothetical protein